MSVDFKALGFPTIQANLLDGVVPVPPIIDYWTRAVLQMADDQKISIPDIPLAAAYSPWVWNSKEDVTNCPEKTWALTYDDGPKTFTPQYLDLLKKSNSTATFFVLGCNTVANSTWTKNLKDSYDAGHQIALHTWSHHHLTTQPTDQVITEIIWNALAIKQVIGKVPRYIRPPYGDVDNRIRAIFRAFGLKNVIWNVMTNDTAIPAGSITAFPLPDPDPSVPSTSPKQSLTPILIPSVSISSQSSVNTSRSSQPGGGVNNSPTHSNTLPPPPSSSDSAPDSASSASASASSATSTSTVTSISTSTSASSARSTTLATSLLSPVVDSLFAPGSLSGIWLVANATQLVENIIANGPSASGITFLPNTGGYISLQHELNIEELALARNVVASVKRNGFETVSVAQCAAGTDTDDERYLPADHPFVKFLDSITFPLDIGKLQREGGGSNVTVDPGSTDIGGGVVPPSTTTGGAGGGYGGRIIAAVSIVVGLVGL